MKGQEDTNLSVDESLQEFAVFCNHFIASNPLQYTIDDICCHIAKVENHNKLKGVDRRQRVPTGVKTLLKFLVSLYTVLKNGAFKNQIRMNTGRFVRVTMTEILKGNRGMTRATWRRSKWILTRAGLLQVFHWRVQGAGTAMWVRLDFDVLSDLISNIEDLKMLSREAMVGLKSAPVVLQDRSTILNATSPLEQPISDETGESDENIFDIFSDGSEASGRGDGLDTSNSKLRSGDFVADTGIEKKGEKQTIGDIGLQQIIKMLAEHYNRSITCAEVRKIQRLRRREGDVQLTPERLGLFLFLAMYDEIDSKLANLPLVKLLRRDTWWRVAQIVNRQQLQDAERSYAILDEVEQMPKLLQKTLTMKLGEFDQLYGCPVANYSSQTDCRLFLPRALKEDLDFNPKWVLDRARKQMLECPILFYTTEQAFPWDILLNLSTEEKDKLRRDACEMIRYAKWVTHLDKHYEQSIAA